MVPNKHNQIADTSSVPVARPAPLQPAFICHYGNVIILLFLSLYFLIIPFCIMIYYLADPRLKDDRIPRIAFNVHRSISPEYENWARRRVASGRAKKLSLYDIAGTEWPVFGSVFYLWATESLQQAWEQDEHRTSPAPKVYAAGAIEAAVQLVADPNHAAWVRQHWGHDYLHRENVFYRMLLISALTSYQKLLGDEKYMSLLQDQVDTLSSELDRSPYGLLDDYPGQCYPSDVLAAVAAIRRADRVLGTDHSDFVNHSVRAFKGTFVDSTGLPPYAADSATGAVGKARGCSSQWTTLWAPQLWPEYAQQLYENLEKHFWQKHCTAVGFTEFPKEQSDVDWYFDVDSGPVVAGFGAAASAFGIGAARANGRFDHVYPLTTEAIVLSWPLPGGTLATPRILSNVTHAPYIGEAAVLFSLTRAPIDQTRITTGGQIPIFTYLVLAAYLGVGAVTVLAAIACLIRWRRRIKKRYIPLEKIQLVIWVVLLAIGVAFSAAYSLAVGLILILSAQFLPRTFSRTPAKT
jgi:hypothetical protein